MRWQFKVLMLSCCIYIPIYITHGAWAIVCYTILQAVQSFMSVNTNSPHAPFFMCQTIYLATNAYWGRWAYLLIILILQIMKQFRLLGMGLLALAMSIGFVACSSDDDSNGSSGNKSKKLVQITSSGDGKENVYLFSYDSNDKLKLYNDGYDTYTFNWSNDIVTITDTEGKTETCYLLNNLIRNSTVYKTKFTYNDNNKLKEVRAQLADYLNYYTISLKWDGDKITECGYSYSYSGKTCKGFNPVIFVSDIFYGNEWLIACPELLGVKSNQLPDGLNDEEAKITYTFDSDGYVTEFTIQFYKNGVPSTNEWETWKYKLTWK